MKYFVAFIAILLSLIILQDLAYPQSVITNICEAPATECKWEYAIGSPVELVAETDNDNYFAGWASNQCQGTNPICKFTMPKTGTPIVMAIFEPKPVETLYVYVFGNEGGRVTSVPAGIDCTMGLCEAKFPQGTNVVLTTVAPNGFTWRGLSCSGTGTCSTTMTKAKVLNVRIK